MTRWPTTDRLHHKRKGVKTMQTALTLRRVSINSIGATFAVLLALTAGGAGGYWLKSQASSVVTQPASPQVARQAQQVDLNLTDAADRAARIANAARAARTPSSLSFHDDDHGH
jgi:hypothetical protein